MIHRLCQFRHLFNRSSPHPVTSPKSPDILQTYPFHSNPSPNAMASNQIEHDKPLDERTYEQTKLLNEYLLLHFGESLSGNFIHNDNAENKHALDIGSAAASVFNWGEFGFFNTETGELEAPKFPTYALNFPHRVAQMALYWYKKQHPTATGDNLTAFDVGCAVGRTAFDLTPFFHKVVGLDYSFNFVKAAAELGQGEKMSFSVPVEGDIRFDATASISSDVIPSRASFIQGNACELDLSVQYDCLTAANLIDRLPSPKAFLDSLKSIIKPGGIVVLTSPYTWLAEYTPVSEWLVGDKTKSTYEALRAHLLGDFELVHNSHMPFFIRETGRKSQFTLAHCTVWQRRA